ERPPVQAESPPVLDERRRMPERRAEPDDRRLHRSRRLLRLHRPTTWPSLPQDGAELHSASTRVKVHRTGNRQPRTYVTNYPAQWAVRRARLRARPTSPPATTLNDRTSGKAFWRRQGDGSDSMPRHRARRARIWSVWVGAVIAVTGVVVAAAVGYRVWRGTAT